MEYNIYIYTPDIYIYIYIFTYIGTELYRRRFGVTKYLLGDVVCRAGLESKKTAASIFVHMGIIIGYALGSLEAKTQDKYGEICV